MEKQGISSLEVRPREVGIERTELDVEVKQSELMLVSVSPQSKLINPFVIKHPLLSVMNSNIDEGNVGLPRATGTITSGDLRD